MKKSLLWQIPFLILLIVGTIAIVRQNQTAPYQHDEGFVFGTIYHVTYQSERNLKTEIEAELKKVDQSLSPFNETSVISKINRGESQETDEMFREVFLLAEKISKETDGAFDITVAPLVNAWGFGFKKGIEPTAEVIDSLRQLVGYEKVLLDKENRMHKQHPQTMLDCSAIAKGYGSDCVARYLRRQGITNFMVEIGGEIVCRGQSEKQAPWRIGVNKPTDDSLQNNQQLEAILNVTDLAMATSGNYRNFYYKNGRKYAHTIDPKTGRPVQHNILSATVLAKDCATADAYATSFMVMGLEGAKRILARHPELSAYLIYTDHKGNNKVWQSEGMKKITGKQEGTQSRD